MKKKFLLPIITSTIIIGSAFALTGCSKTNNDPKTLNVVIFKGGWGDEWLNDVATSWKAKNDGYDVKITSTYQAKSLINKNLSSKNNPDDLYICVDLQWKVYAAQNKFAALDDLVDETVDGVKVKDKINDEFQESLNYQDAKGEKHVYRLPWTAGTGGIFYNSKLFDDNGWKIPTTTDELTTLIAKIKSDRVAVSGDDTKTVVPFTFTGQNTDYFDYAVFDWWGQLEGYDNIKNFYKYESSEVYNSASGKVYNGLKKATEYWNSIFSNTENYPEGSTGASNHEAQQKFYNGEAAMMFNGDWLYNECLNYGSSDKFSLKLMQTPVMTGSKEDHTGYTIGEDQFIAVPESSIKKDLAKSFIKELISDDMLTNFTNKSHGFLAYKNGKESEIDKSNTYIQSCLEVKNARTKNFTNYSSNLLYLSGLVDTWYSGAARPFATLINKTNTLDQAFEAIYNSAKTDWDKIKGQAGIKD